MYKKALSLLVIFCFLLSQPLGFCQTIAQLDVSQHIGASSRVSTALEAARPIHLRYCAYEPVSNQFRVLIDKGDSGDIGQKSLGAATQQLLDYFFIGIALPNDSFWVNLRPDAEDKILDKDLSTTRMGKVLLEADLQLKKDTAQLVSPNTAEGSEYWTKLYKKAEELFGSSNVEIPTMVRPWIVPDEILIRQTPDSAYIYKATLKVLLEQDYLTGSELYNFKDERLKTLNEYAAQLMRQLIIPRLTREVNSAARYAELRQVYYSLIFAQWFKQQFAGRYGLYASLVDKKILSGIDIGKPWSKSTYFKEYLASVQRGEFKITAPQAGPDKALRTYFAGGIGLTNLMEGVSPGSFVVPRLQVQPMPPRMAPISGIERISPITQLASVRPVATVATTGGDILLIEAGNIDRIVTARIGVLPVEVTKLPAFNLETLNLAGAEIDVAPIASSPLPSFPRVAVNVQPIGRIIDSWSIANIERALRERLGILEIRNNQALARLAEAVYVKGAEINEVEIPEIPNISRTEIKLAIDGIVGSQAASIVIMPAAEAIAIRSATETLSRPRQLPGVSVSQAASPIAINDISAKQIASATISMPGYEALPTKVAGGNRLVVVMPVSKAFEGLGIVYTPEQKFAIATPALQASNYLVAQANLPGGKTLLLAKPLAQTDSAEKVALDAADVFSVLSRQYKLRPQNINLVIMAAPQSEALTIDTAQFAKRIGAETVRVEVKPVRETAIIASEGLVMGSSSTMLRYFPLKQETVVSSPVAATPFLDIKGIAESIGNRDIISERAQIASDQIPSVPQVRQLENLLQGIRTNTLRIQGQPIEQVAPQVVIEFVRQQNLPAPQKFVLASVLKVNLPEVTLETALQEATPVVAPALPISVATQTARLPALEAARNLGGIDLRSMKILLPPALGAYTKSATSLAIISLGQEEKKIGAMIKSGIVPSGQRVKEYVEAACQGPDAAERIGATFALLSDMLKLEESRAMPTAPEVAEALVFLESQSQLR
ncbi:MAG: hypothetical protein C4540_01395 [Candidatus Omnitrophota bacterium]|nr:MAG: hypothetical protein C4540_01395 [Candidatus Omnitrophota bacterium]